VENLLVPPDPQDPLAGVRGLAVPFPRTPPQLSPHISLVLTAMWILFS